MAEEVQIAQTGATAKLRNPLGVVGLSLITIGVYYVFWWYFINREMRDLGRSRNTDLGQSPGNSVLALTLGALVIVPAIVTLWRTPGRIESAQEVVGIERRVSGPIVFILLLLIGPVGIWYAQSELNKVWAAESTSGDAPSVLPGPQPDTTAASGQAGPAEPLPESAGQPPEKPSQPE